MNAALLSLLTEATAGDPDIAAGAILRIALLLERTRGLGAATVPANQQLYRDVLPTALQNIEMTEADHDAVVQALSSTDMSDDLRLAAIWALGKAHVVPGLDGLARITERESGTSGNLWYQLCISLHDLLELAEPGRTQEIRRILDSHNVVGKLRSRLGSGDSEVSTAINSALAQASRYSRL